MSTARESGLAALQNGDVQVAITQLETAIQQEPTDLQAHLYLGAAYGQAGRQQDAIRILTVAVRLEPANPQARYNLGIAMEQGSYRDQAIQLYKQALQLQPDYAKAQESLQRLQNTPVHGNDGFGAPLQPTASSADPQNATAPPAGLSYSAPRDQTPVYGQPAAGYSPPQNQTPNYPPATGNQQPATSEVGLAAYGTAPPAPYTPPAASQGPGMPGSSPYNRPTPEPYPEPCPLADQAVVWGFVSMFLCCIMFPVPILRGISALNMIKKNPHMTGKDKAIAAIIMGIISPPFQIGMKLLYNALFSANGSR